MWITQSYLAEVEPKSKIFVYYVFLDYMPEQITYTKELQHHLENFGDIFGDKVSLLFPNEKYTAKIGGELRGIEDLWVRIKDDLPGILLCKQPLSKYTKSKNNMVIIPLKNSTKEDAKDIFNNIYKEIDNLLKTHRDNDYFNKLLKILELKPNFFGIGINIKEIFNK